MVLTLAAGTDLSSGHCNIGDISLNVQEQQHLLG